LPQTGLILFNVSLAGMSSSPGFAVSAWSVLVDAKPDDKVPGLLYAKLARPSEDISQSPPQGDVQAFVPYTFLDQSIYEVIQAGLLRSIVVPDVDGNGPLRDFSMHVVPTSTPRVRRDDSNPQNLLIEFSARMDDAVVATVNPTPNWGNLPSRVPGDPSPLQGFDISTVAATAAVRLHAQIGADANSGVYLAVSQVDLMDLDGQVRFATATSSIAPYRVPLQNAVNAAIRARGMNRLTLMPRALSLMDPLWIMIGAPVLGVKYAALPLSVAAGPRVLRLP
jgi:hypothetical protein